MAFSSLQQRTGELIVDIPVPGRGGGGRGGFQGSHPGQSSTAGVAEQIVEISGRGDPQGFLQRQSTLQSTVEQLVDIPCFLPVEVFKIFVPVKAHPHFCRMRLGMGIYALLRWMSEVRVSPEAQVRRVHPHLSSWTPASL